MQHHPRARYFSAALFIIGLLFLGGCIPNPADLITEYRTLTVKVSPEGKGTITPNGGSFDHGTKVLVQVAANGAGWKFTGWEGDSMGTRTSTLVTMDGDKTLTAKFEPNDPVELTVTTDGQGSVTPTSGTKYNRGETATLTATPETGWSFVRWEVGGTPDPNATLTLVMNESTTIKAVFAQPVSLTINTQGEGGVSPSPKQDLYNLGTEVSLTAIPANADWQFGHWEGDITGTSQSMKITMDTAKTVTAVFVLKPLLTVIAGERGSVTATPTSTNNRFELNSSVTLTASATSDDWQFDHWEGDATGKVNPATVTMDTNKTVTAIFTSTNLVLTVTKEGQGITNCLPQPTNGTYKVGTKVTLTATAETGWHFARWLESGTSLGTSNPMDITMEKDRSIAAVFEQDASTYTLSLSKQGQGQFEPADGGTYNAGSQVNITATPASGWRFSHWTGDMSGGVNPITVTMNSNKLITGVFIEQFTLATTTSGQGSITAAPSQATYDANSTVTVTATPANGWVFVRWEGDVSGTTNPITVTMNAGKKIVGVFNAPLTVSTSGQGTVAKAPMADNYAPSSVVTLTASPTSGWYFDHWEGGVTGNTNPQSITMDSPKTVTAVFREQIPLTVKMLGIGTVAKAPSADKFDPNTVVTLTATPNSEFVFVRWEGDVTGSENPVSVTMDKAKTVTAVFVYRYTHVVTMKTIMGDIKIGLNRDRAPVSVDNFIRYVNEGFYDGKDGKGQTAFHRVIPMDANDPNFTRTIPLIQGGGYKLIDDGGEAGLEPKATHEEIILESNNGMKNIRGTIGMARTNAPNSATSQFYFNVGDNSQEFDYKSPAQPGYAVFGMVIEGMNIVDSISNLATQEDDPQLPVLPPTIVNIQVQSSQ